MIATRLRTWKVKAHLRKEVIDMVRRRCLCTTGENLGVIKYERWERRQGSIEAPMATKPTLPDGMCLPTGKPA